MVNYVLALFHPPKLLLLFSPLITFFKYSRYWFCFSVWVDICRNQKQRIQRHQHLASNSQSKHTSLVEYIHHTYVNCYCKPCFRDFKRRTRVLIFHRLNFLETVLIQGPSWVESDQTDIYQFDLRDRDAVEKVFSSTKFDAVIYFAGLKAVGESVQKPLLYYDNNLIGTIVLLEVMAAHECTKPLYMVGQRRSLVLKSYLYQQKIHMEEPSLFNTVGAHPSAHIGEDPRGIPNTLKPFVQQVAVGRCPALTVYGTDYKTSDDTGVRDYIHVVDLAEGRVAQTAQL